MADLQTSVKKQKVLKSDKKTLLKKERFRFSCRNTVLCKTLLLLLTLSCENLQAGLRGK